MAMIEIAAIKAIIDLTKDLEGRVKQRKDTDLLRQIQSHISTLQTQHVETMERDLRVMQENTQLKSQVTDLQKQLAKTQEEDVQIRNMIEFRRGRRTGNVWMAFCPKCRMPVEEIPTEAIAICTTRCGWVINMHGALEDIAKQIKG